MNNKKQKVLVGMSGGVDSSVTALLLKQQDFEVHGVFMQNWQADDDDPYCSAEQDLTDARRVCDRIGIPLNTVNFSKDYWDRVFQLFLDEYAAGRTPNPDVLCNQEIKFKAFLDHALDLGADRIAMGHYVRSCIKGDEYQLLKGVDDSKDQSYFLYRLNQRQLAHSLFPLGDLQKIEVRKIAEKAGLSNHAKKDSTGICFIGERKFKSFLNEYMLDQPGDIMSEDGKKLGNHSGLMFYTLGQRKGLDIGGIKDLAESPWYVIAKNLKQNQLIVVQGHDHPALFSKELNCDNMNWINPGDIGDEFKCAAKIRYRQPQQNCTVTKRGDEQYQVVFDDPQRAITPGQSVVFYRDDLCLGGGIIS